jgi:hypothetical protein
MTDVPGPRYRTTEDRTDVKGENEWSFRDEC